MNNEIKAQPKLICPILAHKNGIEYGTCEKDRCAWWVAISGFSDTGGCAVNHIAIAGMDVAAIMER